MERVWKRLHKSIDDADVAESLRPGASAAELGALEKALGCELPEDYRASAAIHDGQSGETLFDMWRLLPLAEVHGEWQTMKQLLAAGDLDVVTTHDKKLRDGWWRTGWIPVASNGFGDLLCLDLDPGERGTRGHLIAFWHDDGERKVEAKSFKAWLQKAARELARAEPAKRDVPVVAGKRLFRNAKAAQKAALKGEWQVALEALEGFRAQGSESATASVVYLRAYLHEWDAVLEIAPALVDRKELGGNVCREMAALMVRAAALTGRWQDVPAPRRVVTLPRPAPRSRAAARGPPAGCNASRYRSR